MTIEWQIESFRLSVFGSALAPADAFEQALSVAPDTSEIRKSEGVQIDTGVVDGRRFTVQMQHGRFDWNISSPEMLEAPISSIGDAEVLGNLCELLAPWLSGVDYQRLAVGIVAKIETTSKVDSYKKLATYLRSLIIDPDGSSDLFYRINRPRSIELNGEAVKVNRVSTWAALQLQRVVHQFGGSAPQIQAMPTLIGHWCRCELDINTDAARTEPFPSMESEQLLQRLIALGTEILSQGDIA